MQQTPPKDLTCLACLKPFLEKFSADTGFATTLVDHESQDILFRTGWRDCCLKFHRSSPESEKDCKESNSIMASHVRRPGEIYAGRCNKGLMAGCTPVMVSGQRIADLFMGQVLFAQPDGEVFSAQAQKYAYPEHDYLASLADLPVIDKETFHWVLQFLANTVGFFLQSDATSLKSSSESLSQLAGQFVMLRQIMGFAYAAILVGDTEGNILHVNERAVRLSGYSKKELLGLNISSLFSGNELKKQPLRYDLLNKRQPTLFERQMTRKDGTITDIEMNSQKLSNKYYQAFIRDISERKKAQKSLLAKQCDLETSKKLLEETNIALRVVVREADLGKREFEEKISTNLLGMVSPYLEKLKKTTLDSTQKNYLEIIESSLNNIVSPFVRTSVAIKLKLSPTEIRVANLLKQGMTSKEIANRLILSPQTVDKHRGNIRKKLGITNKKTNLRTILESQDFRNE